MIHKLNQKEIGLLITLIRKINKISQKSLANKLKINAYKLSKIERGVVQITLKEYSNIFNQFNKSGFVDELCDLIIKCRN